MYANIGYVGPSYPTACDPRQQVRAHETRVFTTVNLESYSAVPNIVFELKTAPLWRTRARRASFVFFHSPPNGSENLEGWVWSTHFLSIYRHSRSFIFQHHFFSRSLPFFRRQALATQVLKSNILYNIRNTSRFNTTKASTVLVFTQHNTLPRD